MSSLQAQLPLFVREVAMVFADLQVWLRPYKLNTSGLQV